MVLLQLFLLRFKKTKNQTSKKKLKTQTKKNQTIKNPTNIKNFPLKNPTNKPTIPTNKQRHQIVELSVIFFES